MKQTFLIAIVLLLQSSSILAQSRLLQSGPMLGYNEMQEVLLWAQTTQEATVQFAYWPQDAPEDRRLTSAKQTIEEEAFTAKLIADEVEPGTAYAYELLINGKAVELDYPTTFTTQALWQWRTDPPDFSVALGSCSYINEARYDRPGDGYGSGYGIFEAIYQKQPDAMVWLGDNIYLREVDWYTWTGFLHRYTHTRSTAEMQPLLANAHHYAIWDDHDFGPNNSDRSFIHKDKALKAFKLFWGNPTYGLPGQKGITTFFRYNDIDFFLLDNRYFRSPNNRRTGEATILGQEQLEWLVDALSNSRSPFKMVCIGGQVLNTVADYENYANHHWKERQYLLERIEEEGIRNVVFLTGDRHHTEMSQYTNNAGNTVYDITISPLTSGSGHGEDEANRLRMDGTFVNEQNFGILEFSGPRVERQLTITVYDKQGEKLWSRSLQNNQ